MSIVSDKKILTSKNNRYNDTLVSDEIYTGTAEINYHTQIMTTLLTTGSATLNIDISPDSVNWHTYQYTITAGTFDQQTLTCGIMYVRIRVINTAGTDNEIVLNTYFGTFGTAQQTLLNSDIPLNSQCGIQKSILYELRDGSYQPAQLGGSEGGISSDVNIVNTEPISVVLEDTSNVNIVNTEPISVVLEDTSNVNIVNTEPISVVLEDTSNVNIVNTEPISVVLEDTSNVNIVNTSNVNIVNTEPIQVEFNNNGGINSRLYTQHLNGEYLPIQSYFNRSINVSLISPLSAFGELLTANLTPYAQLQFSYYEGDITSNNLFKIFRNNSSTARVNYDNLILSSGCNYGDYSIIQSKNFMKYNSGQGIRMRGSMLFSPIRSGFQQAIGFGDKANGFYVYNSGSSMSILRRTGGSYEIHKLQINGTSATSDGLITITLNSQPNYITVDNGDTSIEIVNNIVSSPLINWYDLGWEVFTQGVIIYFKSINPGIYPGAFTFTSTATGITDSITKISDGSNYTEYEIEQVNWNDKCDGTTFLPEIDFHLGNVLELNFQWLGYGKIVFNVENPNNGFFQNFHTFNYSNANGKPSIANPNGYIIAGSQNTTPDLVASFTIGDINTIDNTITISDHGFTTGELVCYDNSNTNGTVPTTFTKTFSGSDTTVVLISGQNAIKIPNHTFKNTEQVIYSAGGGTQITGLTNNTIYYIIYRDDDTIQLAATLADVATFTSVNITSVGVGVAHTLSSFRYYIHVVDSDTVQLLDHFDDISAITLSATGTRLIKLYNCYAINIDGSAISNGTSITKTAHGLLEHEAVKYANYSGGSDISGLTDGVIYYVSVVDTDTFSLTEYKEGPSITLSAGTGNEHHFITSSTFSTASLGLYNEGIIKENVLQTYSIEGRTAIITTDATEFPMLALFVKKEYYNKNNSVPIKIKNFAFSYNKESATDKEVSAQFKVYINPTFSSFDTANTFNEITDVSVCEYSTLSSTDRIQAGTGSIVLNTYIRVGGSSFDGHDIELQPGDMIVITGARTTSSKNIILNSNITWYENF
jgi:hypothetical protein